MHRLLSGALSTEKLIVKIPNLPLSLAGLKLVQMSDFHYDNGLLSEKMLTEAIAISNAAKPDLVILTGDYVNSIAKPIHQLALRLKKLESRYGTYAVLGNHDICYPNSKSEIIEALTKVDINVLWNKIAYPVGKELPLVGLADVYSREFNPEPIMNQLDSTTPRIVLSHNPDTAEILQKWRVDLQLSGHSHGGQIVIPGLGPAVIYYIKTVKKIPKKILRKLPFLRKTHSVLRHWEWSEGLHQVGHNQLYVNRGLGTYYPGRLFCPPEVTIITLQEHPASVKQACL
ncbi:metallophosphoesterase [Dolichospermum sp. ST_con]|nr:metallophosphoesterase [Dolichospermum sp. ST_con]MDD1417949.1 metallophosphoesterase [Dolichospermum sp. ST_sed1]MDD1423721.1 metallophosphoesterase [Dolichospermum sp. ST_sed9]MDD1431043.1 metallophosphoesterase [Dolichospermum sp. ST_sed6]MDD1439203.1 metallophosphoesterase [Dolichospermum sp. ST_sed3]MDD1445468.1 metallophosphoesterase [Dolichospermum sp. ST_sed8]MDD1453937.1 metallophosphoesterase [Dolichospermum sp. ST_sed7]MDD1459835.1 metallophosphoesterase [Dolichospermum sp. ST_